VHLEDAREEWRRDDGELGQTVPLPGPHDVIAVTEREPGDVTQRRQVCLPISHGTNECLEQLGACYLALSVHGDIDVRVLAEVRLDVSLVLRRIRAAVNRDVPWVRALDQLRVGEVVPVRPDVVREEVDPGLLSARGQLVSTGEPVRNEPVVLG
jgi:hypothetical protein